MKNNILLIYGEDTYRSRQKLEAIKQKYIDASLGDTNLAVIEGERATIDEISRQLYALPFLAKNRLVVMQNFLTKAKAVIQEKMLQILDRIPQTTVALFYEQGLPDKRNKLFKKLNQPKLSQQFESLNPAKLSDWINNFVAKRHSLIQPAATQLLIQSIGPDLWRLSNELEKLTLYSKKITADDVKILVDLPTQTNIFALLDAVGNRDSKLSFLHLRNQFNEGQPGLYLLAMLARSLRNLALVKSGSVGLKIHPYVLQKTTAQARNFDAQELKKFFELLAQIDYEIKIGKMDEETGLTLFVAQATQR